MDKKSQSGSLIRDKQPGSYLLELRNHFLVKILKFCEAVPGSGILDRNKSDPGWKKVGSGINKPDPRTENLLLIMFSIFFRKGWNPLVSPLWAWWA
jgi:hypothetical protein